MIAKRIFDLLLSISGLIILSPFFLLAAVWIKADSKGPVFFLQERVGRFGHPFWIYKFRTMYQDAGKKGLQLTVGNDPRITRSGAFLRHYKLDELPQLINVIMGNMSLVGPRPEVPKYVAYYPPGVREMVLSVLPGMTDYAAISFKNENFLLDRTDDPERAYIEEILPVKLQYYQEYVTDCSVWLDFKLILLTVKSLWGVKGAKLQISKI
jgi:lipopolysaccharide/colanic/teichoic acid biosynthesis glycosyltransferase